MSINFDVNYPKRLAAHAATINATIGMRIDRWVLVVDNEVVFEAESWHDMIAHIDMIIVANRFDAL